MANLSMPSKKRTSVAFLQGLVVLFGLAALAFLLGEPHLEGRNAHSTVFEVYFKDPFLAYVYLGSIPLFIGLYQAFKLLGYAQREILFSPPAVKGVRTIKFCAIALIGFVAGAEVFIMMHTSDDRAGGVFMGILISFGCIVTASAAAIFERILQNALDLKNENDLTV